VAARAIDTERDFLTRHDLPVADSPGLDDPPAAWRAHVATVTSAFADPQVPSREFDGYFGRTTLGATLDDFYGWDLVIHGWDVARATGQDWSLSDEEARAMHATADGWGDALYSEGVCAPPVPVPDSAPASERLLGRLGRDPQWVPSAG